jgi:phosphoenolpyruvate-protein phosphotransferase
MSVKLKGIAASPGIAIAPAYLRASAPTAREERPAESPEREWCRYQGAVEASRAELTELRDSTRARSGDLRAEIFDAHLSMLKDPELSSSVSRHINERGLVAGAALEAATAEFIELLSQIDDELFKGRIDDVRDLGRRVLAHLEGAPDSSWRGLARESIVVADSLSPSETATLDPELVRGFATAEGSATSHSSILARSMEIPAVVGLAGLREACRDGGTLIIDGSEGLVIVDPEPAELEAYRSAQTTRAAEAEAARRFASLPTISKDDVRLELAANIGSPDEAERALAKGAEGVGLFRSEFLYMDRPTLPSEDEQCEAYGRVLGAFAPRPVIIRTLDIGGDKAVDCLDLAHEPNPFLGVRAIRLCFEREDLFRVQLRALLRASVRGKLRIMFPMIATIEELRSAKAILAAERRALEAKGIAVSDGIEVGIMIEIPAAAMMADQLAEEAGFFSVGTNDLVQYSMAADRMNPKLAYLNQALHPAVLRLLGGVARAAKASGIMAGVCGEMAADRLAIPLLVGMGFEELSMSAASIPASRQAISRIDSSEARALYGRAKELQTAEEVRRLVKETIYNE